MRATAFTVIVHEDILWWLTILHNNVECMLCIEYFAISGEFCRGFLAVINSEFDKGFS